MQIYLLLIGAIVTLGLISWASRTSSQQPRQIDRIFGLIIAASATAVLALRSTKVGVDIGNYVSHFERLPLGLAHEEFEPGYEVLNRLVYALSPNEQLLIAVTSFLAIAPVGYVINRYSANIYLSWLLFVGLGFYSFTFSGLRQGIALAACFVAYHFMARAFRVRALLAIVVAVSFHASAVIFLPALLIYRTKFNPTSLMAISAMTVIVWVFREPVYVYFGEAFMGQARVSLSDSYTWLAVSAALFALTLVSYSAVQGRDPATVGLYPLVLTGVLLMMFTSIGDNALRAANYYYQFIILLVPNALALIRDATTRALLFQGISVTAVALFIFTAGGQSYNIVPYAFFWK